MAELAGRLRTAAGSVPGITLRPPDEEFFAHATLAYSRQEWDARELDQLVKAEPVPRAGLTISRVSLVSERQDPVAGIYTWTCAERLALEAKNDRREPVPEGTIRP